ATCAPCRNCSATPTFPRPRSTPTSTTSTWRRSTTRHIRGRARNPGNEVGAGESFVSGIRRLHAMPGRRRAPACLHGHVRWIDPAFQTVLDGVGLLPQVDWRTLAPGEAASESRVTNCFRVRHPGGEVVYFKRYVYTRHKKFRHLLRPSRAMTEAFGYRQLAAIGIPTPEVVAFSEHRRLGRVLSTCIVVREVPASRDLERFAVEELRRMTQQGRREALEAVVSILAGQLRLAHAAGFFHQDLHWRNLLISGDTPDTY